MEDLLKTGKVKSIGVSNFSQKKLEEEILPYATVVPAVDQVGVLIPIPDLRRGLMDLASSLSVSSSFTCIIPTTNSWSSSGQRESSQRLTPPSALPDPPFSTTKSRWRSLQNTPSSPPMCSWLGCVCPIPNCLAGGRVLIYTWPRRQKGMCGYPKIHHPFSYRCQPERVYRGSREIR